MKEINIENWGIGKMFLVVSSILLIVGTLLGVIIFQILSLEHYRLGPSNLMTSVDEKIVMTIISLFGLFVLLLILGTASGIDKAVGKNSRSDDIGVAVIFLFFFLLAVFYNTEYWGWSTTNYP